ncbi:AI-2E family transporter [Motiliproteus sp. MSK22-1]|uniref:AI-2E family transporter n=1 Tax=Motiliproteus sp. MSK22-1 TaxID=1897630 RepID=UPI0009F9C87E|nr:AI-2E family transporter [Motiliproteus sp. MSK22-1]
MTTDHHSKVSVDQSPLPIEAFDVSRKDPTLPDSGGFSGTGQKAEKKTENKWRRETWLLWGLLVLAVIYTLELVKELLIPVALALLLSLLLAPLVRRLERLHLPRPLGAGVIVLTLFGALSYGIAGAVNPVGEWIEQAPTVLRQLERKVYPIKKTVEEVSKTADKVDQIATVGATQTVEIKGISLQDMLYANTRGVVTGTLMASLLLYFLLSWGSILLARIGMMLDDRRSGRQFLELFRVVEGELSKYLSTITLINIGLGAVVAVVLYLLEMPNPMLWGAVAGLLNFIPYLGGLVTALLLAMTSLLNFDGLFMPTVVVSIFVALTIIEGQILTPLIVGRRLALNPLIVFLSVIFWFWLWGMMGALMAVPILISLKLMGDRVAAMKPLALIAGR